MAKLNTYNICCTVKDTYVYMCHQRLKKLVPG